MANTYDLTVASPQEVIITNTVQTEEAYDAGSLQRSNLYKTLVANDENKYEEVVVDRSEIDDEDIATAKKVAYKTTDRKVQMYKTNTYVTLKQGDSVKITAEYSEEVAYFISLASKDLSVEVGGVKYPLTDAVEDSEGEDTNIPTPALSLSVDANIPTETDLLGKSITDLQSNIVVSDTAITGTLNYVTGYTGFSSETAKQSGNYLALLAKSDDGATITGEVVGGDKGPVELDADGIFIAYIADNSTQSIKFTATKDDEVVSKTYSLTDLVLNKQ